MAISSSGYLGNFTDTGWSRMTPFHGMGRSPVVQNVNAWQVGIDPNTANARSVIVKAGWGFGDGILDQVTTDTTLSFPAPSGVATGASVFGAVVMNRNWSTQVSTLKAVMGTSGSAVPPAGLVDNPGVETNQVICLARLVAGNATVAELLERRLWVEFARVINARRQTDSTAVGTAGVEFATLDASAAGGAAGTGAYMPAGQYSLHGEAIMSSTVTANGALTMLVNPADGGTIDLVGQPCAASSTLLTNHSITRRYDHAGGPLTVHLRGTFGAGVVSAYNGSSVTATWVGPLS